MLNVTVDLFFWSYTFIQMENMQIMDKITEMHFLLTSFTSGNTFKFILNFYVLSVVNCPCLLRSDLIAASQDDDANTQVKFKKRAEKMSAVFQGINVVALLLQTRL